MQCRSSFAFNFSICRYVKAAYVPVDHVMGWGFDEAPSMCEEREVPDGGHKCVADLAITQLVFRQLCIGKPYCRLSAEEVVTAMAPHVSAACGAHVMTPRLIAQCRPLNLPLALRQMPPQSEWFMAIQVETRTRDEDFPIAMTSSAHMRAMFCGAGRITNPISTFLSISLCCPISSILHIDLPYRHRIISCHTAYHAFYSISSV